MIYRLLINVITLSSITLTSVIANEPKFKTITEDIVLKDLIEYALHLSLKSIHTKESDDAETILHRSFYEGVMKGDYKKAFEIIMDGIERFPEDFGIQTTLAILLGDFSNHFPDGLKNRMIQRSKEIFSILLPEIKDRPKHIYYWFMNEYFYRFEKFKEQYELGVTRVNENLNNRGFRGYYSQGVGAANYAKEQLLNGNKSIAYEYAQKALVAWAQHFSYENNYYNALVHYSMALAILGYKNEALKALEHAAELIQKDHVEFQEIRDFIHDIEKLGMT